MPINFNPVFSITPRIASCLMRIEAAREKVTLLPLNPTVLASLRQTAKLYTTHYSTMIEGNRLNPEQIKEVLTANEHFSGRERDEREVKGYYAALAYLEQIILKNRPLTENLIKTIHALVMGGGRADIKPTPYRDGQNVIKDTATSVIVYLPPEAHDVPKLMKYFIEWIRGGDAIEILPCPVVAAIVHYQFATIHPYYDGNGRTARILTTLVLHQGGYDLKGLYCLEEYYAKDLRTYYQAISIGPSHNYYFGRAESDITGWIEYFIEGMAVAFEKVVIQMSASLKRGEPDHSALLRTLDSQQRKVLELFQNNAVIKSSQISELFSYKARTSAALCKKWVENGFLEIVDSSKKGRKYALASAYKKLIQ